MSSALYQALSGNGQQGAPAIQSNSPIAPAAAPPSAAAGPSLYDLLSMKNAPQKGPMLADANNPFGGFKGVGKEQMQADAMKSMAAPSPTPNPQGIKQ